MQIGGGSLSVENERGWEKNESEGVSGHHSRAE